MLDELSEQKEMASMTEDVIQNLGNGDQEQSHLIRVLPRPAGALQDSSLRGVSRRGFRAHALHESSEAIAHQGPARPYRRRVGSRDRRRLMTAG